MTEEKQVSIILEYIGGGFIHGVPARNLTQADIDKLTLEKAERLGLMDAKTDPKKYDAVAVLVKSGRYKRARANISVDSKGEQ